MQRGERSIRIECCLSCAVRTRVLRELCIGGVSYYNAQARVNGELNGESSSSCLRLPNGHFTLVIALIAVRWQAEGLTQLRHDEPLFRRLDDGNRVTLLLSHGNPVVFERPHPRPIVAAWDLLAGRAEPARTRCKHDNIPLALLELEEEIVIAGRTCYLRVAQHRRQHLAGTLRHHRVATSNQNNLAAGIAIGTRLTSRPNLVHHAVARRVSHACQCVCSAPRAHRSCRE